MAHYVLHHRHEPDECGVVFASFKGQRKMAFYGDPSPRLAALVDKIGVDAEWFTLLQALERENAH